MSEIIVVEGNPEDIPKHTNDLSLEILQSFFHLPIKEAVNEIKICETTIKKRCRDFGIKRWPYRKINCIDNLISSKEFALQKNGSDTKKKELLKQIKDLKRKRTILLNNPSIELKSLISYK